jgi:hypothetical protein
MEMLDLFLEGSLVHGQVSPKAREAIRRRASDMGLTDEEIDTYLDRRLTSVLAPDEEAPVAPAWDPYTVLGIRRDAELEVIEQAYRSRYRWARSLRDLGRAQAVYQELDRAWRDLSAPERRAAIDAGLDPDGSVLRVGRSSARTTIPPVDGPRVVDRVPSPAEVVAAPNGPRPGDLGFGRAKTPPPAAEYPSEARGSGMTTRPPSATSTRPPSATSTRPRLPLEEAVTPEPRDGGTAPPPTLLPFTDPPAGPSDDDEEILPARLHVDIPATVELTTWFHPVRSTFHVTNEGAGPMPGTLTSSQPWLTVSPRTLDPHARDTLVEITFWPRQVPGRTGTARLSVTTAHGQRRVITVRARKRPLALPIAGISIALVLLAFLASRAGVHLPFLSGPDMGPIRTRLSLVVSPPADAILLDGERVGGGPLLELADPAPPGRRVRMRIERLGCLPYEDDLVFGDGQRLDLQVKLQGDPATPGGCT